MKKTLPKTILIALCIFTAFLTSCSKNDDSNGTEAPATVIKKEDPSLPIPKTAFVVTKDGDTRTITITGQINEFYFDQLYHKADGSQPGSKESIRTAYRLNFDKVVLFSNGKQPFTFSRTSPYNYVIKHTISSADYETNRISIVADAGLTEKEY